MIAPSQELAELSEVLERIQSRSRQRRLLLARCVLDQLDEDTSGQAPIARRVTRQEIRELLSNGKQLLDDAPSLEELDGFLATDAPPPTDEECRRWLEEERLKKYG